MNDDEDLLRIYQEVLADNTLHAVSGFEEILRGTMNIDDADKPPGVEEDHLRNCWKSPPIPSTPSLHHLKQRHPQLRLQHKATNKQLEELEEAAREQKAKWEKEAKAQAKEQEDAKWEILSALELSQPKEDSLTSKIQQLFAKTTKMENRATEMAEWRIAFDAEQKK
eukprot:9153210-Ditylum_brightwellii.AAC.1